MAKRHDRVKLLLPVRENKKKGQRKRRPCKCVHPVTFHPPSPTSWQSSPLGLIKQFYLCASVCIHMCICLFVWSVCVCAHVACGGQRTTSCVLHQAPSISSRPSLSVSLESALRPCWLACDLPPHAASTFPTLRLYVLAAMLRLLSIGSGYQTQVQGKPFTEFPHPALSKSLNHQWSGHPHNLVTSMKLIPQASKPWTWEPFLEGTPYSRNLNVSLSRENSVSSEGEYGLLRIANYLS